MHPQVANSGYITVPCKMHPFFKKGLIILCQHTMTKRQNPGTANSIAPTDYTGTQKQKKKRGFKLQREAKEWKRNFLETQQADLSMTFENFAKIYNEDMRHRLREHTFIQKQYVIDKKLLPFFGKIPVSQITPAHIRKWQNSLMAYRDENDKPYSETYLRTINIQLSAIMNYAVRYYNLRENPCRKAGSIGKSHADEMQFWTTEKWKLPSTHIPTCFLISGMKWPKSSRN